MKDDDDPLLAGGGELSADSFRTAAPDGELYSRVRARTLSHLKRRRTLNRAGRLGTLALAYGLGLLTALSIFWPGGAEPPASPRDPEPQASAPATPLELEQLAARRRGAERIEILERAGDLYLAEWGDVASALRCYRELIRAGGALPVREEKQPSWLLAALTLEHHNGEKR